MQYTIFFDIETSREAAEIVPMKKPPVIQIAAVVRDEYGVEVETFERKIKFLKERADQDILDFIGYTDEKWADAIPPLQAAREFAKFVKKYVWFEKIARSGKPYKVAVLAAHNARQFDIPVIMQWYRGLSEHFNTKIYFPAQHYPAIDTLEVVRTYQALTGKFGPAGLKALCAENEIELEHHNAVSDVRGMIQVYDIYVTKLYEYHVGLLQSNIGPTGDYPLSDVPE